MSVRILGDSPASAFLAASLGARGVPVAWFVMGEKVSLRPALLRTNVVDKLRRLFSAYGHTTDFLDKGPELEAWGPAEGRLHRFRFNLPLGEFDRWVDAHELTTNLATLARSLGVSVRQVPVLPTPGDDDVSESICVVDAEESQLDSWPRLLDASHVKSVKWQFTEVWFQDLGHSENMNLQQFALLEGSLACLEPHPVSGFVLTFLAKSRYAIERALKTLSHPKSSGPRLWRALYLMNPGARRRDGVYVGGLSTVEASGAFPMGAAIGHYSPCLNLQVSESIEQADRLFGLIVDDRRRMGLGDGRLSDQWIAEERRRFQSIEQRMSVWERLLVSERFHGDFLAFARLLPRPVRHYLKTPV